MRVDFSFNKEIRFITEIAEDDQCEKRNLSSKTVLEFYKVTLC